jgi:hypothetical protein
MDPSNLASKYATHFIIFKDGCAEDWVKWLMAFRDIETFMTLKEPADKSKMVRTLSKGQALLYFEHHLKRRLDAKDAELPHNMLLELMMRGCKNGHSETKAVPGKKSLLREVSRLNKTNRANN